jgi:hypothetical protein
MEGDAEEIVEVRAELPPDLYALVREGARKRGMAPEDFLSILVECDIRGTEPAVAKSGGELALEAAGSLHPSQSATKPAGGSASNPGRSR